MTARPLFLGVALCLIGAVGCGGPTLVPVTGTVKIKGEPIKLEPLDQLGVTYFSEQNSQQMYSTNVTGDGSFKVSDHTGKGIPPGNYKIVVQLSKNGPGGGGDRYRNDYSKDKTTLRHEVRPDNATIALDLKAPGAK